MTTKAKVGGAYVTPSSIKVKAAGIYGNSTLSAKTGGAYQAQTSYTPLPAMSTVVGIGDSITFGTAATDAAHRWLNIVSTSVGAGTPANAGISSTVLQNSNGSGGTPLTSNGRDRFVAATLGAIKKDGVFFAYGYNDARYVDAPSTFNVTEYLGDYREVLNGLIAGGYDRNKIVIVSPYWISDVGLVTGTTGFFGQTRNGFEAFVAAARTVAVEYGVRYVDAYAAMRDGGGVSLIDVDNIHPTNTGHAVIAAAVINNSSTPNSNAMPGLTASSVADSELDFSITAPVSGTVTNYSAEYALNGSFVYSGTQSISGTTGSWTGLSDGTYRVRVRANFSDGSKSPWVLSGGAGVVVGVGVATPIQIRFTNFVGPVVESSAGSYVATGATFTTTRAGTATKKIAASSGGSFYCTLPYPSTADSNILGTLLSSTNPLWSGSGATGYQVGIFNASTGFYRKITLGAAAAADNSVAPAVGDIIRLRRVIDGGGTTSTIYAEISRIATPTTFVLVNTWTNQGVADIWPATTFQGAGAVQDLSGIGVV